MRELVEQVKAATLELLKQLKKVDHVFITSERVAEWGDEMYDAPRVSAIDKYEHYNEYAITHIKDGRIYGFSLSEDIDNSRVFEFEELTSDELFWIVEVIS